MGLKDKMLILVTGANGQLGQNLIQRSAKFSFDIHALSRGELSISDVDSVNAIIDETKPGLVINCGAYTAVEKAEEDSHAAYVANRDGPAFISQACRRHNIPLFHVSTDYVFDGCSTKPYTELDSVNPIGVYARSKEAGEQNVRRILKKHIILRTSWVFSGKGTNFPKTILRLANEREFLRVVNDQVGAPTSAASIADALLQIAEIYRQKKIIDWGTYHFCQTPSVSWFEFAKEVINIAQLHGKVRPGFFIEPCGSDEYPSTVARPKNSRLNMNLIQSTFGIKPTSWVSDLETLVAESDGRK